jgi:hypothetical protein
MTAILILYTNTFPDITGFLSVSYCSLTLLIILCSLLTVQQAGSSVPSKDSISTSPCFAAFVDGDVRRNSNPTRWRQGRFGRIHPNFFRAVCDTCLFNRRHLVSSSTKMCGIMEQWNSGRLSHAAASSWSRVCERNGPER